MDISITRIRKAPGQIRRYRDIVAILAKYGLSGWLQRLPLGFVREVVARRLGKEVADEPPERRLRKALQELGPTFIKLGQLLSVRPDIVGLKVSQELQGLLDRTPADGEESVRHIIESELGRPVGEIFRELEPTAVASASVAQVHRAILHSGEEVAVKVQHAGVQRMVETDVEILLDLADLLERHVPESRPYRPKAMVEEFSKILLRELDFRRELHHLEAFRSHLEKEERICIPKPFAEFTTQRVLTMEYLEGLKASDPDLLRSRGVDLKELAHEGARIFLAMVFEHGLFHGDPHPGNLLVMSGGRIGLLDFGMVGRLDEELRHDLEDILMGMATRDTRKITGTFVRMGAAPPDLDRSRFQADLQDLLGYYAEIPLGEINAAAVLQEMIEVVRRHRIVLPPDLALLAKVMITLDGTGRGLYPEFRIMDFLLPYRDRILMRRLSPARQMRKVQRVAEDVDRLIQFAPAALSEVIRQMEGGKLTVQLRVQGMEEVRRGMERSANRLAFALLTAALVVSSSLLMLVKVPPLLWGHSALGLAGYGISLLFAARILWAIFRSGRLN